MINRNAKIELEKIGLLDLVLKYFPDNKWDIQYRQTKSNARNYTVACVNSTQFYVRFYSALFNSSKEVIKHTILHEYAHVVCRGLVGYSHCKEFYSVLHLLEQDENCTLTQNKWGINNLKEINLTSKVK